MSHQPTILDCQPDAIRLIVHADDAGMSRSVNAATIEALENGIVSSVSVLVPAPRFLEFAAYAREHPQRDFGVHLALTSEWESVRWKPLLPPDQVPTLVDSTGMFWKSVPEVARYADIEEVEKEMTAQIELAISAGIILSHLDSHQGALFSRPDLTNVYLRLASRYELRPFLVESVFENHRVETFPEESPVGLNEEVVDIPPRTLLASVGQFYDDLPHPMRKLAYLRFVRNLRPGLHQLIVHCGRDDAELRSMTRRSGLRESDLSLMLDPDIRAEIARLGIILTEWQRI